jgi:ABC-type polysaccharide/polyol phosphate export permease
MPLLGKTPDLWIWLVAVGLNCVGGVVAVLFFSRYRERIAYWV